jgi:hypothetical protein
MIACTGSAPPDPFDLSGPNDRRLPPSNGMKTASQND